MTEEGVVVSLEAGRAKISLARSDFCSRCRLCKEGGKGAMFLEVIAEEGVKVGDRVEVEIPPGEVVKATLLLFLLPLLGLIGGYFLLQGIFRTSPMGIVGAIAGFILSFLFLHFRNRRLKDEDKFKTRIVRRL